MSPILDMVLNAAGGGETLDNPELLGQEDTTIEANAILGHIWGQGRESGHSRPKLLARRASEPRF